MNEWKDAARAEVHKLHKMIMAGLDFHNKNKPPCDLGLFQTRQTQRTNAPCNSNSRIVPMEVDAATTQPQTPFKKLTNNECEQYHKEGRCFQCHQKGHMAWECAGRHPQNPSSPPSTTLVCAMSDSTTVVNVAPSNLVSNAPTVHVTMAIPKLTRAQQIARIEEEMSDEERSAYLDMRDMDLDFYGVGQ